MAFSDFRSYDQVIAKYGLGFRREDFVPINRKAPFIDEYFRQDIAFVLKHFAYQRSDPAAAEALIFPILKELWKSHCETLTLLSHEPLQYDEELTGVVDYAVCNRSSLGTMLPGHPFLLLVGTAKDDHFDRGWGQALSSMVAVRRRDTDLVPAFYGIATNGQYWRFGKLENNTFILDMQPFTPSNLDSLIAALHHIFTASQQQVLNLPTAA